MPSAPPAETTRTSGDRFKIAACILALAALLAARNPYVLAHPQFWHEDALIFLLEQREHGAAALWHAYSGYLHTFQRMIALIADSAPLALTPTIYVWATMAGWLAAGAVCATSPLFKSRWMAFAATLALAAIPHSGEVFLVLTNIQWPFAAILVLLAAEPVMHPPSRSRMAFAGLAAITGPFSLLLTPLAIWRLASRRISDGGIDRLAIVMLVGATIQAIALFSTSTRAGQAIGADSGGIALTLLLGVFPEIFGTMTSFPADLPLRLAATTAGAIGLLHACGKLSDSRQERLGLIAGGALLLLAGFAICVAKHGGSPRAFGAGARYLYVPFVV